MDQEEANRLKLHLAPPTGWLNDPNGLCQFQGTYHVFYQYAADALGESTKEWGHYTSKNLTAWERQETALFPDRDFDRDGVYSGGAYTDDEQMYLFYTGNVKEEGGDYDYTGRESNTVLVTSRDGIHFSEKELLLTNADYPKNYTCHIRDPKVWKENGRFYMLLGGRRKKYRDPEKNTKETDIGTVLLFSSGDLRHFQFERDITTEERFGYMWECPDYFVLGGAAVLSVCPQGLASGTERYQNVYQSGYFLLRDSILSHGRGNGSGEIIPDPEAFCEWDMGFDFYAPQTFCDERGRRILIGWAGMPDADYDNEPTVRAGWQHALTIPRELTLENGRLLQNPVEELQGLRGICHDIGTKIVAERPVFELELTDIGESCRVTVCAGGQGFCIAYEYGCLRLSLTKEAGRGRTERRLRLDALKKLRLFVDTSMVEIFVNGGEAALTSRFYIDDGQDAAVHPREIGIRGAAGRRLWYLDGMEENG